MLTDRLAELEPGQEIVAEHEAIGELIELLHHGDVTYLHVRRYGMGEDESISLPLRSNGSYRGMSTSIWILNRFSPSRGTSVPVARCGAIPSDGTASIGFSRLGVGRSTAERIRGAQLVPLPNGGHLLLGHQAQVRAKTASFLRSHSD